VTTVTLDRKAVKNAVDRATAVALAAAFRAFDADPEARVAVLYGDHGTFCAGADLKALATGAAAHAASGGSLTAADVGNRVAPDGDGPMGPTRMVLGKPVIAAIAGHAVAGGLELALWCDLRVAEDDAVLGVFCRRFGVPLIDGGTIRLPRLIGLSRALDLILTGRPVRADEALAIGLVNRVVPRGESLAAAHALAHQLAALPQRHRHLADAVDRQHRLHVGVVQGRVVLALRGEVAEVGQRPVQQHAARGVHPVGLEDRKSVV